MLRQVLTAAELTYLGLDGAADTLPKPSKKLTFDYYFRIRSIVVSSWTLTWFFIVMIYIEFFKHGDLGVRFIFPFFLCFLYILFLEIKLMQEIPVVFSFWDYAGLILGITDRLVIIFDLTIPLFAISRGYQNILALVLTTCFFGYVWLLGIQQVRMILTLYNKGDTYAIHNIQDFFRSLNFSIKNFVVFLKILWRLATGIYRFFLTNLQQSPSTNEENVTELPLTNKSHLLNEYHTQAGSGGNQEFLQRETSKFQLDAHSNTLNDLETAENVNPHLSDATPLNLVISNERSNCTFETDSPPSPPPHMPINSKKVVLVNNAGDDSEINQIKNEIDAEDVYVLKAAPSPNLVTATSSEVVNDNVSERIINQIYTTSYSPIISEEIYEYLKPIDIRDPMIYSLGYELVIRLFYIISESIYYYSIIKRSIYLMYKKFNNTQHISVDSNTSILLYEEQNRNQTHVMQIVLEWLHNYKLQIQSQVPKLKTLQLSNAVYLTHLLGLQNCLRRTVLHPELREPHEFSVAFHSLGRCFLVDIILICLKIILINTENSVFMTISLFLSIANTCLMCLYNTVDAELLQEILIAD